MLKPNPLFAAFVPSTGILVPKSAPLKSLWEYSTMSDEIIKELWQIKDNIAWEHGYDLKALVAHLQTKKRPEGQCVVDLRAIREAAEQGAAGDALKRAPER